MDPHVIIKVLSYLIAFLLACQIMDAVFEVDIIGGISTLLKTLWGKIKPKEETEKDIEERTFDDIVKDMESNYNSTSRGDEIFETYLKSMGIKIVPKKEEKEIIDVEFVEVEEE